MYLLTSSLIAISDTILRSAKFHFFLTFFSFFDTCDFSYFYRYVLAPKIRLFHPLWVATHDVFFSFDFSFFWHMIFLFFIFYFFIFSFFIFLFFHFVFLFLHNSSARQSVLANPVYLIYIYIIIAYKIRSYTRLVCLLDYEYAH